jgi:RNA ligase (TIGR02306 family)
LRKLASIQKIIDIQPIEGADAIEVATVLGWKVVIAKKDNYKIGDLVVYCEVDSFIPTELAPFLSKGQEPKEYNGVKGERLRTVKLRGTLSQGLILSISDDTKAGLGSQLKEGIDLTDHLFIQKWEPPVPACLSGVVKGAWPSAVPKTDQERIQNLRNEYSDLRPLTYEVTCKLDGSSCTMGFVNGEFIVCSRNLNLRETEDNTFWKMARKYDVENLLRSYKADNIVLQGEVVGEGIQGNLYNIKGQEFYVYDIYDVDAGKYLSSAQRLTVCHELGFNHVPVISTFPLQTIECLGEEPIDSILKYAEGKSVLNPAKEREGVVFKQIDGQTSFKAISNKFLLKTGS